MDGKEMVEYIELCKSLRKNLKGFWKYNFIKSWRKMKRKIVGVIVVSNRFLLRYKSFIISFLRIYLGKYRKYGNKYFL